MCSLPHEELRQAEEAVSQADARLTSLAIDLERHSSVAPVDSVVDSLLFEVGERPAIGQPMAILLSGRQPYARVFVAESLRVHVAPGTSARIFVDGLEEPLAGRVRWVASEAAFTPYFALTERLGNDDARLTSLAIDLERHSSVAPVDSVVDSLLFEVGERPAIGQPMAILLSGRQPYARVFVAESLRVHVAPGTSARIFVDGLEEPLAGRVRWVASEAAFTPYFALTEHDRGRLSFVAKVDVLNASTRLPDGVPVEVELLIDDGSD